MDLMHNPIGNMYGPHFLVFYAIVIASVFIITKVIFYFFDPSESSSIPQVPSVVDPYEIAYLRGGENEIIRLVILDLIQRGYLERVAKTKGDEIAQAKDHPDERHLYTIPKEQMSFLKMEDENIVQAKNTEKRKPLNTLQHIVFSHFSSSLSASGIFQSDLDRRVKEYCINYQRKLEQDKLILTDSDSGFFKTVMIGGLFIIIGLGSYKLFVALATYHFNVLFLIMMGIGATFLYLGFCRPPRMSIRGGKYLERLELAYERLDNKDIKLNYHTTDPTLLLMAGIFGVVALEGTVYSYYPTMFQKANNRWYSSGSCGAGCGYAGSSCGSGGSCGGGGCGGGGCGGCGG